MNILCFSVGGDTVNPAYAEGSEPYDARARIGFGEERGFYLESDGGEVTLRVYISAAQTTDTAFTLSETRFGDGGSLFVFADSYTLPAGSGYADVTFNQISDAEAMSGVRLSDIYIHCDTETVTVGDVEYYGESEPYDDDLLAVVYDKDGQAELIMEGLPYLAYETDGTVSSRFVRSGAVSSDAAVYYGIKSYNPADTRELIFDNYNSVLSFDAGERVKTLELEFFDNQYLNLREAYTLDITRTDGIIRIFDLAQRRYLGEGEAAFLNFAIMDDEPFSDKYIARAQYYQPGLTDPFYQVTEGSALTHNVIFDGLNGNPLPAFRLYYTVGASSTAVYGDDYVIGGSGYYNPQTNLGYIEVPAGGEQYFGDIAINTVDDALFNGTRTVFIKFFVNNRNDILLQPLDTVRVEITDNERLPENNTVRWSNLGSLNGCGWYDETAGVLTIDHSFYFKDSFVIGTATDYMGTAPLNIPVRLEDITARNGRDYYQESAYSLLTHYAAWGTNLYGIDLNIINDFYFSGIRTLKATIIQAGLTDGLTLAGSAELIIELIGRIENDYNYFEYTQSEIDDIFSVGKNETLTFTVKRAETAAETTYIDISREYPGAFIEGIHFAAGLFPYALNWAEKETEKQITLEFLQSWTDANPAGGLLTCLSGDKTAFNNTYGENQRTSVPITLYLSNSAARYYFPGSDMVSLLQYEYLYSSDDALRIAVKRELLSAASADTAVDYHLTFDYYKVEQRILAGNTAEIGTHIDGLSGTLYFYGTETIKYITVTVPDTVNMTCGSKYVNLVLSEPSAGTYLLYDWDYAGKFSLAQIKITNDITPVPAFGDLTTKTVEEGGYETTAIDALEYEGKKYDSFRVELIPYETDETPYLTNLYYSMDIYLYAGYDLSAAGVEVFGNGIKLQCVETDPYIYNYTDGSGTHTVTYNCAYVLSALLNKENPYAVFTLKYSETAFAGLGFVSTSLLIKTDSEYFLNGWETFEKQLFLNACGEGAGVDIEMSPASLVSGGETDVQAGDVVYLTLTRSSADPGADTMFFRSAAYGVKSFASAPDAAYYYEPLDALVVFEPYERSKTVAFLTRDNRPDGVGWDGFAAAALIKLYDYYNSSEVFGELIVNVREDWPVTLINADVVLLTNYVYIHKRSGEQSDPITVKFVFDKAYDTDIEFTLSGLDGRLGNLSLVLPAGETEIIHSFTFDENGFHISSDLVFIDMTGNLDTVIEGAELKLAVPDGLYAVVSSERISSQKFHAGTPDAFDIDEDDNGYISLDIIAYRSEYPSTWSDVIAYVALGGTAVYGADYIIKYDGKGSDNAFDTSTGIIVIWKLFDRSTLKIYPIDNSAAEGNKTIELTVLDYHYGYAAYPETFILTLNDNEYFGDVGLKKSEDKVIGRTTVTLFRENFTNSSLTVNYEVEEIYGVYGTDYIIGFLNSPDIEKSGALTFYGASAALVLYVRPLTELGETALLRFRIFADSGALFSIKTGEVFVSLRNIYEGGEFTARTASSDTALNKWPGNYGDFLLDYTKYYSSYSSGAKVKITSGNFAGATENIYLDFNPDGLTYISASGRSGEYAVPSGINPVHWYDIDGDGVKELIFVANLDACFGGAAELAGTGLCGVYALSLIDGGYTQIFALDEDYAFRHLDVYIRDLKGDGYPDAVVLSTQWADSLLRKNGGNILYIIDNEGGTFSVGNVYDGNAVINGTNMTLYSVVVGDRYNGNDRTFIEISYYSRTANVSSAYGAVIELSAGNNARFLYCEGLAFGAEGDKFAVTVTNVTGAAGTAVLVFESADAVYGRDYLPDSLDLTFAEGEYVKTVYLVTLNNDIPTNAFRIDFHLESDDFSIGNRREFISFVDRSVVNREVAYTVLSGFESDYRCSEFITGDSAAFSLAPLTINGIRCAAVSNDLYDVRLSVRFGSSVWTDSDRDGFISVTGLKDIYLSSGNPHYIYMDVEFLREGTDIVFSKKTFSAWYYCFDTGRPDDHKVINNVQISETIFMGKLAIFAESIISIYDKTPGRFSLSFTSSIDNKTYTFYSGNDGYLNAQIDFGSVQGIYTYSYVITPLSVPVPAFSSGERTLRAYRDTMDFPITVIDSVRQSLLRNVLIEIVGINVNFSYSGYSDADTGLFIVPALKPLKTYRLTVNSDYGVNYFNVYTASFTPTVDDPNLSVSLELRTEGMSLDRITVNTWNRASAYYVLKQLANKFSYTGDCNKIFDYLSGANVTLDAGAEQLLYEFLAYCYYWLYNRHYGDVIFSNDYPSVYRSMSKEADDVTLIFYRYNPGYDFGDISILLNGQALTEENSIYRSYPVTYDEYHVGNFQTDVVHFYAFGGSKDCLLDMKIESDAYLSGVKSIPLVSYGTGLGSFLLQPVQEIFESLQTAQIPSRFAFIDGMSFMLGFADVDFAYDYDEENMTFSLYMGASKAIYEASHGMKYDKVDRPSLAQLRAAKAAGLGMGSGQAALGVGLGGKMIFEYSGGEWRLTAGEIYFSVSASYNFTKYILLPVVSIPAFFSATIGLNINTTIWFDWNEAEEYTEVTGDLAIELSLEIECGIGIKGFLSASVYGKVGIEVIIQLESGGTKLTLYVEGGVRICIIFWSFNVSFGRAEWSTQSGGYVDRAAALSSLRLSQLKNYTEYSGVAMLYSESGELVMGMGLGANGQAEDIVLVSNIYEKSSPRIAELADGTKMIAWINYDLDRGENNAEVINYIYFDGESWSEVAAADDTLTADLDLDLRVIDGCFAIICTEVNEELSPESTISERLIKSDVAMLVFDPLTRSFTKTVLTNNLFNDRQALFDFDGEYGIAAVYRSENTNITDDMTINDFLCGENADNKLYYSLYDAATGSFGAFSLFAFALPAVSNMSLKVVNGIAYIALECDNDDNFDTTSDREIMLLQYVFATGQSRITRLTDNDVQDLSPSLMEFKGKVFMAYRSGDDVRYWYENESYYVCTLPQSYTNFEMFASGDYAVMLFTMPVVGVSQVFASVMDGDSMMFSAPAQVTCSDKPARDPALSFAQDALTVYYCADTYMLISSDGEEYSFSVTSDIAQTAFPLFSNLYIEVLAPDLSAMLPETDFDFTVRICNSGTVNVVNPWIKVRFGETLLGEFESKTVPGNGYLEVQVRVTLPSGRGILVFEAGKDGLNEGFADNFAEVEVLLTDIAIDKDCTLTWNEDGTLTVDLDVTNSGAVDAEHIIVSVTAYSDLSSVFASAVIPVLTAGETKRITLTVPKENVRFNANNELWLKAYALTQDRTIYTVSADDYDSSNNVKGFKFARPVLEGGSLLRVLQQSLQLTEGGNGFVNLLYIGDDELIITSSDESILFVDGRNVAALKAGTAVLTITDGTETTTLSVTVLAFSDPGEPSEPGVPEPVISEPENSAIKWWVYVVSAAGLLLLIGAAVVTLLIKKGILKMRK